MARERSRSERQAFEQPAGHEMRFQGKRPKARTRRLNGRLQLAAESLEIRTMLSAAATTVDDVDATRVEVQLSPESNGDSIAGLDVAMFVSEVLFQNDSILFTQAGSSFSGKISSDTVGMQTVGALSFRLTIEDSPNALVDSHGDSVNVRDAPQTLDYSRTRWLVSAAIPVSNGEDETLLRATLEIEGPLRIPAFALSAAQSQARVTTGTDRNEIGPAINTQLPVSARNTNAQTDTSVASGPTSPLPFEEAAFDQDKSSVSGNSTAQDEKESRPGKKTLVSVAAPGREFRANQLVALTVFSADQETGWFELAEADRQVTQASVAGTHADQAKPGAVRNLPPRTIQCSLPAIAVQQATLSLAGVLEDILLTLNSLLHAVGISIIPDDASGASPVARTVAPVFPGGTDHRQLAGTLDVVHTVISDEPSTTSFLLKPLSRQRNSIESLTIELSPRHGSLTIDNPAVGTLRFAPNPGFRGADSAVWRVRFDDGSQSSGTIVFLVDSSGSPQAITEASAPGRLQQSQAPDRQPANAASNADHDTAFSSNELMDGLTR